MIESNQPLDVGQVIADRYRIVRSIGRGGMSVVVEAAHLQLGRRIALKLVPQRVFEATGGASVVKEARAAALLSSEHSVRVFDCGMHGSFAFIAMELLAGRDLKEHLAEVRTIAVPEAVAMILQVCEAIAEAHAHGIVHADLKPSNLFVGRRPDGTRCMKVLDFGIARSKSTEASAARSARTGRLLSGGVGGGAPDVEVEGGLIAGSPGYAAPEQLVANESIDPRADIWALGVVLYQMVSGQLPFAAGGLDEALLSALTTNPRPLSSPRGPLPEGFAAVVKRCLGKDREERFANVGELVHALAPFSDPASRVYVKRIWTALSTSSENAVVAEEEADLVSEASSFSSYAPMAIDATFPTDDDEAMSISRDKASLVGELVPARPRTGIFSMLAATLMLVVLTILARNHLPASRAPVRTAAAAPIASAPAKPAKMWVVESGPPTARVAPPIVASVKTTASAPVRPMVKMPSPKRPPVKGRSR